MAKDFKILNGFGGYRNKRDTTNIGSSFLVEGSQNTIINDGEKVFTRKGYTVDGVKSMVNSPIKSSFEWLTNHGVEIPLRSYDDTLQFRYDDAWHTLQDGFASTSFQFATVWDFTEQQELLLLVNGDSSLRMWSGGIATLDSATANTITKENGGTWTGSGFLTAGTRSVFIGGIEYSYTGGENTDTLTGVTPDPTIGGHSAGDIVHQSLREHTTTPGSSNYRNDIIAVLDNQVWIADTTRLDVFVSKNSNYIDFTFSAPRKPGEGVLLNLDSAPRAFVVQEDVMYIGGSKSDWYASNLTLSSDLLNETLVVRKLKSGPGQGPKSQGLVGKVKNNVVYVSEEPTLDILGRQENVDTPQSVPISDLIKKEFSALDFREGHILYFKNQVFIALPREGRVYIYDFQNNYWQPPQVLPVRRLAVINDELYGHSSISANTYKLFNGTTDDGNAITSNVTFAYRNFGLRAWQKTFDEWYTEGYISPATEITMTLLFDYNGFSGNRSHVIRGNDQQILFNGPSTGGLGHISLGKQPLGGLSSEPDNMGKFRVIHTGVRTDFYEMQVSYGSDDIDQEWEILAVGGNVVRTKTDNNFIKK